MRSLPLLSLVAGALAAVPATTAPRSATERTVAGYTIERTTQIAIRDSGTGYYLIRDVE